MKSGTIPQTTSKRTSFCRSGLSLSVLLTLPLTVAFGPSLSFGQQSASENLIESGDATAPRPLPREDKRIFGIIPNNRTSPSLTNYKPLSTKEKFQIARQDSFDRGTVILAAAFAGDAQLTNADRPFGQGVTGYARYFGASYGDFVIGNYMSEAIYPILLHQDPRYFRRGIGSGWSRLGYSIGQIFWTHTDSDRTQFNYSEILGNSAAVAISEAYYPDNRNAADASNKARHADRRRYGVERPEGILAGREPEIPRKDRQ